MLTAEVGERTYRLIASEFREVLNGESVDVLIDHDRGEVRLTGRLADLIREVSAYARETAPAAPIPQNDPPRPVERTARRVPVTISGCFRCYAIAWPWW
jgi:hypothetical protein